MTSRQVSLKLGIGTISISALVRPATVDRNVKQHLAEYGPTTVPIGDRY
jgi:hypothetical protein